MYHGAGSLRALTIPVAGVLGDIHETTYGFDTRDVHRMMVMLDACPYHFNIQNRTAIDSLKLIHLVVECHVGLSLSALCADDDDELVLTTALCADDDDELALTIGTK